MLMKEFKSAHSKMFSKRRATEAAAASSTNDADDGKNQDQEHENIGQNLV